MVFNSCSERNGKAQKHQVGCPSGGGRKHNTLDSVCKLEAVFFFIQGGYYVREREKKNNMWLQVSVRLFHLVPGARLLVPGRQPVVRTEGDGAGGRALFAVEGQRHQRAQDRPRVSHQVYGL